MKDYADSFKRFLLENKKASDNTIESYMRDMAQFSSYCASEHLDSTIEADNTFLRNYTEKLRNIGKSEATVSRIIASLRCYYRFLLSEKLIDINPADGISSKKTVQKLPGILTANEIMKLLSQTDGIDFKSIRDKAMLELLYATGIKVSELIDLTLSNINLQIGILHLTTGKKERIIPIYPAAVKSISDYLENVRPAIVLEGETDRIFTNMTGKNLSRQGFWKIIKHYAELAGIKKDITPHTLRHSFAAHLLENGASLADIKEMLGHSDISSTQVYAKLMKSKYNSAYSKYHPLAR